MGGEVTVAEAEPGRLHAVRRELLLGVPGLLDPAPAALGVDAAAEGVHHRVEVGADLEPVHPDVVGGVGDHGHRRRDAGALAQAQQPLQEPGAADPAGEHRDAREAAGRTGAREGSQTIDMAHSVYQLAPIPDFRLTKRVRQACNHTSVVSNSVRQDRRVEEGQTP